MTIYENRANEFHRFMRAVEVGKAREACWIWQGNKPDDRYGHFSLDGKTVKAHRWIYEFIAGPIPHGLLIRHKCDNPQCVNPRHLEIGTTSDNTRDKFARGRGADRKGEKHPLAKLNAPMVLEIRRRASLGETHSSLAEAFGVGRPHIQRIIHRANWSHI